MKNSFSIRFLISLGLLLGLAAFAAAADSGGLRVGAARVDVTTLGPAPATPPTGKYAHEHLFVRAIVLDNGVTRAVLIGADQGMLPDPVWKPASTQIAAELDCPVENIIMSPTHTHSGGFGGPPRRVVEGSAPPPGQAAPPLVDKMLEAVRQAKANLQPARVAYGTGLSYLNVNRDAISPQTRLWTQAPNLQAPSDKTVAVVKFETPAGQPIAVYVNYAMHPVNLYLGGITSADFPGAACRYIEQIYGDKVVVAFSQGASGDQNPLYLRPSTVAMLRRGGQAYTGQPLVRESVEAEIREGRRPMVPLDAKAADDVEKWIEAEGMVLAEEVLRVMDNMPAGASDVRLWASQKMISCPGRQRTNEGREGAPGAYVDGGPVNIRLGALTIGHIALATIDAEVYSPIGQAVKKQSPLTDTVVVTMANGAANSGYIPTDDAFGRYTFQVLGSRLKPGCAETAIPNALMDLLNQSR
jgi:hypothetical protein